MLIISRRVCWHRKICNCKNVERHTTAASSPPHAARTRCVGECVCVCVCVCVCARAHPIKAWGAVGGAPCAHSGAARRCRTRCGSGLPERAWAGPICGVRTAHCVVLSHAALAKHRFVVFFLGGRNSLHNYARTPLLQGCTWSYQVRTERRCRRRRTVRSLEPAERIFRQQFRTRSVNRKQPTALFADDISSVRC